MIDVDLNDGWEEIKETKGLASKLLSGDFNEDYGTGFRTRLVRIDPGGETFAPFTHPYWEEVYLLEGTLTAKDGRSYDAPAYVIRPPGTPHGPFVSVEGCLMLEMQYFADRCEGGT